ncbi:MAG: hypothetical protein WC840_04775 [Candidatus Peribacteraceae bacterium]
MGGTANPVGISFSDAVMVGLDLAAETDAASADATAVDGMPESKGTDADVAAGDGGAAVENEPSADGEAAAAPAESSAPSHDDGLTPQQRAVIRLMADGLVFRTGARFGYFDSSREDERFAIAALLARGVRNSGAPIPDSVAQTFEQMMGGKDGSQRYLDAVARAFFASAFNAFGLDDALPAEIVDGSGTGETGAISPVGAGSAAGGREIVLRGMVAPVRSARFADKDRAVAAEITNGISAFKSAVDAINIFIPEAVRLHRAGMLDGATKAFDAAIARLSDVTEETHRFSLLRTIVDALLELKLRDKALQVSKSITEVKQAWSRKFIVELAKSFFCYKNETGDKRFGEEGERLIGLCYTAVSYSSIKNEIERAEATKDFVIEMWDANLNPGYFINGKFSGFEEYRAWDHILDLAVEGLRRGNTEQANMLFTHTAKHWEKVKLFDEEYDVRKVPGLLKTQIERSSTPALLLPFVEIILKRVIEKFGWMKNAQGYTDTYRLALNTINQIEALMKPLKELAPQSQPPA